jgi:hypothetical protein
MQAAEESTYGKKLFLDSALSLGTGQIHWDRPQTVSPRKGVALTGHYGDSTVKVAVLTPL